MEDVNLEEMRRWGAGIAKSWFIFRKGIVRGKEGEREELDEKNAAYIATARRQLP